MGRSFYLYPKNGTYNAEIIDPETGVTICYRTTGTKSRDEAMLIVAGWLRDGIPLRKKGRTPIYKKPEVQTVEAVAGLATILKCIEITSDLDQSGALEIAHALKRRGLLTLAVSPAMHGRQKFIDFLRDFWDFNKSPYFEDLRMRGKSITQRTCRNAKNIIEKHWQPYFNDKTLGEITRADLRKLGRSMRDELAGKTINNIISIGTKALRWAYREKMIPEDVTLDLGGFSGGSKKRDIFSTEETEKLFIEKNWVDKMAYAAALLALTTGLRNGEIRALRGEDIGDKLYSVKAENGITHNVYMLYVRHGWNFLDGLKTTKNGEEGTVHLLPEIRNLLLTLLENNPYLDIEKEKRFIFWGIKKDRPCGAQRLLKGLRNAIEKAEINVSGRKIDLHSFRHENGTVLVKKTGDLRKVSKSLRHKSLKMTEHYTDHVDEEDIADMGAVAAEAFNNILKLP
jgi:integrase